MNKNRFLHTTILKVNATGELLIQGKPYLIHLYTDEMTGINYAKLYRYQLGSTGDDIVIKKIDTIHPVRSYRYNELSILESDKDEDGYVTNVEIPLTNDTILDESDEVLVCSFCYVDLSLEAK